MSHRSLYTTPHLLNTYTYCTEYSLDVLLESLDPPAIRKHSKPLIPINNLASINTKNPFIPNNNISC